MKSYSQRDPSWANIKIGNSNLTIGRFGCTLTSIADLSTYFRDFLTPLAVRNICKFTPNGLLIWESCVFENFRFESREYGRFDHNIQQALKDPDRAVILQVANGSHWVVATGKPLFGNKYKIADPWLGDFTDMSRYGNNITGAAYFKRI